MARGRPWTKQEDGELRRLAGITRDHGIQSFDPQPPGPRSAEHYLARLRAFAERHGRTYAAVRKRASRLGFRSYTGRGTRLRSVTTPASPSPSYRALARLQERPRSTFVAERSDSGTRSRSTSS